MGKSRQLVLNKGIQQYVFRYEDGSEGHLLDAIVECAGDSQTDFDWFDAAVLSFKLTQSLIGQADKLLHNDMHDAMQSF
ncbi:MAG: hypothetical protein KAS23_13550 [Anaerohalosphaera sp.]|nr:hypothetical protein [Anaerohalosphaera sp.]